MARLNQDIDDFEFSPEEMNLNPEIIQALGQEKEDDIVDVPSLLSTAAEDFIKGIDEHNKQNMTANESKKVLQEIQDNVQTEKKARKRKPKKVVIDENNETRNIIENATGLEIPAKTDALDVVEALEAASDLHIDTNKVEVERTEEKTEDGFYKAAVTLQPKYLPSKVHILSKMVINVSKGKVLPRTTELRVIVHTNETQLRNSQLKLTGKCVTYKPKQSEIATKKGTRVIVSIPDSGDSWFLYLSDGRDHRIFDIPEAETHIEWIAKRINDFFTIGIETTAWKIHLREIKSPMMDITDMVLKTGEYQARPVFNKEGNRISYVLFYKKNSVNGWLRIALIDKYPFYNVEGFTSSSRPKESAYFDIHLTEDLNKTNYTFDEIEKNLIPTLDKCFDRPEEDWYEAMGLGIDSIASDPKLLLAKLGIMKGKLSFRPLKQAFESVIEYMEDEIDNGRKVGIHIDKVVEKEKMQKALDATYKKSRMDGKIEGECIVGGTDKCKFVLTYMLLFLNKRDKRVSSEFITSDKYYYNKDLQRKSMLRAEHYTDVKDTRPASERDRSLAGRGEDRNYHSGDYVFMLEYTSLVNGHKSRFISKTFNEMMEKTGFLTEKVRFNVPSEYDKYLE